MSDDEATSGERTTGGDDSTSDADARADADPTRDADATTEDDGTRSVAGLAEYCRTQAGLLAGRAETIRAETDALLDEIDADIAAARERLAGHSSGPDAAASPPTAGSEAATDLADLEDLESELEQKQAVAEAKQARMAAFQDLSDAYAELAADLENSVDDGADALARVARFERERDAPAYFEDRLTVLEAVADANE